MFKENDPQTILDKKGSEYLKTGVTLPTTPSISHSTSQPPLPPMLISRGFTSFVLSSNIDRGDGGAFLSTIEGVFVIVVIAVSPKP